MGKNQLKKRRSYTELVCMNLGWIKVIGELKRRTKKYILLKDVLEIRINPLLMQVGVFPLDYPINMEILNFMKIYDFKYEYGKETIDTIKDKYYDIKKYLQTGYKSRKFKPKIMDEESMKKLLEHEVIN